MHSLKSRFCRWNPDITKTVIQLQQLLVILQQLTSSTLKHYGYAQHFKSNRFGKRFKNICYDVTVLSLDKTAD